MICLMCNSCFQKLLNQGHISKKKKNTFALRDVNFREIIIGPLSLEKSLSNSRSSKPQVGIFHYSRNAKIVVGLSAYEYLVERRYVIL